MILFYFILREGITISLFIRYCTLSTVCATLLMLFFGGDFVSVSLNVLFIGL